MSGFDSTGGDGSEEFGNTPPDLELEAKLAQWRLEALGDEEHIARTVQLVHASLSESGFLRDQVLNGDLSIEEVGEMASLVVSDKATRRNFGGSLAVGEAITRLLPPDTMG